MAYIEIDKKAYFHNLDILVALAGAKEKVSVVLKDNAYGHGIAVMADLAHEYGISRVVVRSAKEASEVSVLFDEILVLSDTTLAPTNAVVSINQLEDIARIKNTHVCLKVDTGMHRSGISVDELEEALKQIDAKGKVLHSVFTHFRSADVLSSELFWQMKLFDVVKEKVRNFCDIHTIKTPLFHSANSATLLRLGKLEDDFARVGLASYGYDEMPSSFNVPSLKPILSLWGEKIASRMLKKGERVGYGGSYTCGYDMVASSYDVGYGDGFLRYNGEGDFYPNTDIKPLGRISMDGMSVEGDKDVICILSDVKKSARFFNTITYDILVKLSPSIKRIVT